MVSFYKNISIAVLPTISEGVPAVAMEAQSSGIPMILNDIEQNERAISDGKTGYRVNDNEISTYANHIIELLTNKEKFIELSENCL